MEAIASLYTVACFETAGSSAAGQYTEWDDVSIVEVDPLNGNISGATIAQPAGRLGLAYSFDGINDYVYVYSAELNSLFNPNAGTLLAFPKVSGVGVWTDATYRYLAKFAVDANNVIEMFRSAANNRITVSLTFGGVNKGINIDGLSSLNPMLFVLTYSKTADRMRAFYNGIQSGSDLNGLGNWIGNLGTTATLFGAGATTGGYNWSGLETHMAYLRGEAAPAEILQAARLGGVA